MKKTVLLLFLLFTLQACGYSNPYMTSSTEESEVDRTLHVKMWDNYSGELGFQAVIHQRLIYWLNKSPNWRIVEDAEQADYFISGVIESADFPGLAYNQFENVRELRAEIRYSYTVETEKGKTILRQSNAVKRETFSVNNIAVRTEGAKREALRTIADDIADEIYIRLYRSLSNLEKQKLIR